MNRAWYAFRVMLHQARRDPLWALGCIIFYPLRLGVHALKVFFFAAFLTLALLALVEIGMEITKLKKTVIHSALNIGATLIGLAFLLRAAFHPMVETFGHGFDGVSDSHGSARFATKVERAPLAMTPAGLLIGRDPDSGALLRYAGPAHLLTMAPTRTGKGVGTIIPNLLTLERSILCIDPKGENAMITAKARNRFGRVHILDPFGVTGLPSSAFNPLGRLDPEHPDAMEDANALAEALVQDAPAKPAKLTGMRKPKPSSPG